jgi:DNA repair photolyase
MLNKSTGNMYYFITHTWNTIKGECPHNCSYCYMHRWGKQQPIHFDDKELRTNLGKDNFIFIGSSCDMFAEDIPEEWILSTFEKCANNQDNKYFFQSKNPRRMIQMLKNASFDFCVCTTIETNRTYPEIMNNSPSISERMLAFSANDNIEKYVTIEPVMDFDLPELVEIIKSCNPIQVNIGADSGHNNLPEPSKEKVLSLIDELNKFTVVANKHNLGRILNA